MHELSITQAIVRLLPRYVTGNQSARSVHVRVGAMQAIVPHALGNAWKLSTAGTSLEGVELIVDYEPWQLHCPVCGRSWASDEPNVHCACGHQAPTLNGTDELTIESIDVDESTASKCATTESIG